MMAQQLEPHPESLRANPQFLMWQYYWSRPPEERAKIDAAQRELAAKYERGLNAYMPASHRAIERAKLLQAAARRRCELARWQETMQRIASIKPCDEDEAVAKAQSLELLREAVRRFR